MRGGSSLAARKSLVVRDCMVADAILSNPSPLPNSLLTGQLTGNFAEFVHLTRFSKLTPKQFWR